MMRVLLALLLAPPALAVKMPDCLHAHTKRAPKDLAALQTCQKKAKSALEDKAEKLGKPLSEAQLDAIDDHQRAEAHRFLSESRFVIDGGDSPAPSDDSAPRNDSAPSGNGAPTPANPRGGSPQDASSDPRAASVIADVRARLAAAGVTDPSPALQGRLLDALTKSQGEVTPEIQHMIDAAAPQHAP